ncbi:MAG: NAD+ synthase [Oligoflexia bacterium]|nr:NAD+ synthase [Oligoflexia bacterium]
MRIALAQIDPVVGAFESNVRKIKEAYENARQAGADLVLTPELGICGYPPHDLVERPEMFDRCEKAIEELCEVTRGSRCALAVGHVARNPSEFGRAAQNVVSVLEDGKVAFRQAKSLLPTYDVFDETRYFEPAAEAKLWSRGGKRIAFAICEDLWAKDPAFERRLYRNDPIEAYRTQKADLLVSLSASPYVLGKRSRREELHREIARELGVPLIYVNQVGATDEILFDGGSFALDSSGRLLGRLPVFQASLGVVEFSESDARWNLPPGPEREDEAPSEIEALCRGLVVGIRDYFAINRFQTAILGLSGGIDSAVVATLAARALGPQNVLGVAMPSQYSSGHSLEDAEQLARNLGLRFEVRPIKFLFSTSLRELSENRGTLAPLAQENLQSRLRGNILMTLSNHYGSLVLTTGNKSELAMGYCTLYGDMCGALAPLGDILKVRVYELARHINASWGNPIPERSLTKAPSAELRPNQTDQDTLPPYELLDQVIEDYVEKRLSVEEIEKHLLDQVSAKGYFASNPNWIREVLRKLELNEYKRRQSAPVLKISPKAFGIGRRIPVAKVWTQ